MVGSCAPTFSIIIPVLNEASNLEGLLLSLQKFRDAGVELILADGGSSDDSVIVAKPLVTQVVISETGRATQMNAGAAKASGDVLIFLHADTQLSQSSIRTLAREWARQDRQWGRFDVRLSGKHFLFRVIEFMMNLRSKLTGIATGDQGIFVERALFVQLGGFANIPLMEDVELSKRLKRYSKPICVNKPVTTSSRRWEEKGVVSTILLMWRLRLAYFLGCSPSALMARYYPERIEPAVQNLERAD